MSNEPHHFDHIRRYYWETSRPSTARWRKYWSYMLRC